MTGIAPHGKLRERAAVAVADEALRRKLGDATDGLGRARTSAQAAVENYEELRDAARVRKGLIVARLPEILGELADKVERNGGTVHWAADAAEAQAAILAIARRRGARHVVKSKSMATEEIGLNDALERIGIEVTETDLGEWIIQLAGQAPSHIIAPAIHLDRRDVAEIFNQIAGGNLSDVPEELCAFAREQLRERFMAADIGISGCNFGVADTGSVVLVTNEGNGRMTTTLPPVHIAVMGMERVVQSLDELDLLLTLLPRAATGQDTTVYVNMLSGPRRDESEGPEEFHLVILDNGRSELLGSEFHEMLNCIRCGACLNVCPVYRQIGGHAYDSCYSGPMGAVLTPLLSRAEAAGELSDASTLCGACYDACPVKIPLQDLLLALRRERGEHVSATQRVAWSAWAKAWSSPSLYRLTTAAAARGAGFVPERLAPGSWTEGRTLPRPPAGGSFRARWRKGDI